MYYPLAKRGAIVKDAASSAGALAADRRLGSTVRARLASSKVGDYGSSHGLASALLDLALERREMR